MRADPGCPRFRAGWGADAERDAQRYERNSALGGLIACGLIGVPLLFVLLMLSVMPRVGVPLRPTIYLLIMAVVLIAWFVVVVKSAGGNLLSWRRSWKKDRRS